ncbi:MAG: hypothetical protein K5756_05285 [Clostridiales bacterium]|nr:hypothetical protein [Clostridiales bacterium]
MSKKITALILLAVILIALPGCGIINAIKEKLYVPPDWNTVEPVTPQAGGKTKYYYKNLSNKEKIAYSYIFEGVENFESKIEIPELDQDELSLVFSALLYDNPEFFHLKRVCNLSASGKRCYFNAFYCMDREKYNDKLAQLRAKVEEIKNAIGSNTDQYIPELYIHDYIVENCSYRNTENLEESTAYGALINGYASCEGYSKAAQILFDAVGIESYVLAGESAPNDKNDPESHMWNVVLINGKYYYLDVTWDDPVKGDGSDSLRHVYFNMSEKELSITHSNYSNSNLCDSDTDNYYVRNKLLFNGYDNDMKNDLVEMFSEAYRNGELAVEIKLSSKTAYKDTIDKLIKNGKIYPILAEVVNKTDAKINKNKISYINNDNFYIIEIVMVPKK